MDSRTPIDEPGMLDMDEAAVIIDGTTSSRPDLYRGGPVPAVHLCQQRGRRYVT